MSTSQTTTRPRDGVETRDGVKTPNQSNYATQWRHLLTAVTYVTTLITVFTQCILTRAASAANSSSSAVPAYANVKSYFQKVPATPWETVWPQLSKTDKTHSSAHRGWNKYKANVPVVQVCLCEHRTRGPSISLISPAIT